MTLARCAKASATESRTRAAYIRSWLGALPEAERKAELLAAITAAQKISDYVLGLVLAQQEDGSEVVEALTVSGANTGREGTPGAVANEPDGVPFGTKVRL